MKKRKLILCPHIDRIFLIFLFSVALDMMALSAAQFTPDELAQRPQWEKFLMKAKVIKSETLGEGVTKPKKLLLRMGDVEAFAVWKRPSGTDAGLLDKWESEIAAYRLDKLLGLNMVPPTIERRHKMYSGSLQLWVDLKMSERRMLNEKISIPEGFRANYEKSRSLQRVFDSLIANSDRTLENLCYSRDWSLILIDHSRAFRDGHPYLDRLIYGKNGQQTTQSLVPLPRGLVARLRSLNREMIRSAVELYLTSSEIDAILIRKKLLLQEIDELIREKGESAVLYENY